MRVVLAPDKFKGSLTASAVCDALAVGMSGIDVVKVPVADGGDGTVDAALAAGWAPVRAETIGATGDPVLAMYARRGDAAIVEVANTVGLALLNGRLDPLGASTFGLGIVIRQAIDAGAREITIAVGGSASTDGGRGMLDAIGPVGDDVKFVVATDVDSPLLGPDGAAYVYGPQKGASPDDLAVLEDRMRRWADDVGPQYADVPGAGAAGGTAFGAIAVLGATVRSGIDLVLDFVDLRTKLAGADLVVTGEGFLDEQSLSGKAPIGVARLAGALGVPVIAVAGGCGLTAQRLAEAGIQAVYPLAEIEPDLERSIANAADLLQLVGNRIAEDRSRC